MEQRIEALKAQIRAEKDSGSTKEDLINQTILPNELIEEVYSE